MDVEYKSATIENTGSDDDYPGTFSVVLSTGTKDRDGEEVKREEWQEPLPDHITFDIDHGMSVEKTVGSGKPYFDDQGRLLVNGTYSSLQKAQDVRTLVKEGHIRTTSVAFARHRSTTKDGKSSVSRELLNGAFVAVPANTDAVVLASKAGARNSASDQQRIQEAHDLMAGLGATCGPSDDTGAAEGAVGGKSAKYDAEQLRTMLDKGEAIENADGEPSYPIADIEDLHNAIRAVGRGAGDHDKIRAYIIGRAKDLGATDEIPANWTSDGSKAIASPTIVVTAEGKTVDAAAIKALDPDTLVSVNVSGSIAGFDINISAWCVPADELDAYADSAQRALTAALQIASDGPVDDDGDAPEDQGAPTDTTKGSSATDDESAAVDALTLQYRALRLISALA
jgi:hypothetical protein